MAQDELFCALSPSLGHALNLQNSYNSPLDTSPLLKSGRGGETLCREVEGHVASLPVPAYTDQDRKLGNVLGWGRGKRKEWNEAVSWRDERSQKSLLLGGIQRTSSHPQSVALRRMLQHQSENWKKKECLSQARKSCDRILNSKYKGLGYYQRPVDGDVEASASGMFILPSWFKIKINMPTSHMFKIIN